MSETDSINNLIDDEEAGDKDEDDDESYKDEEEEKEEEDPASALNWVCCDECERWRIVGKPVNDAEGWVCRSHDRDCSEPEDVDQVLAIPVPSAGELTTDQKARAAANRLQALELQKLALIPVPSAGELTTDQKARAAANRLRALELQKLALTRISR
jgi:hypothetical protein